MRPWASWTAKTALLAAGFAAAGGGLSGVALAGTGGSSTSGNASVLSGDQLIAPVGLPVDVCGNAAAVLGDSTAGCAAAHWPARAGRPRGSPLRRKRGHRREGSAVTGSAVTGSGSAITGVIQSAIASAAPALGAADADGRTRGPTADGRRRTADGPGAAVRPGASFRLDRKQPPGHPRDHRDGRRVRAGTRIR